MITEKNKNAVRRFIQTVWTEHNPAGLNDFFSEDHINHALPLNLPQGLPGVRLFASAFLAAFPDIETTIDNLTAQGNKVAYRWTARATHKGELTGMPATGQRVQLTGIAMDRFEHGKSVEHWEIVDQLGLMQQLGVIPVPETA